MAATFAIAAGIALGPWQVGMAHVAAASVSGLFAAFDILYIVFGALLLLHTLERSGGVNAIRRGFHAVSEDRRVQVVIVAWLFGSFIEGAAGFGAPAAIASPLMVAMGFPPACAVMLGMMIQSTAVTFGAVGTPVLLGVSVGFGEAFMTRSTAAGVDVLREVAVRAASVHAIVGVFMPSLMCMMMTRFFGARRSWREGLGMLPFTLLGGVAFTLPYVLAAWLLGPEFPSLLGGLTGLATMTFVARKGWLRARTMWDFPSRTEWPPSWGGHLNAKAEASAAAATSSLPAWKAWFPYVLLASLLVLTRMDIGVGAALKRVALVWPEIFGTEIVAKTTPLYLPGTILVLVVLVTSRLHGMPGRALKEAFVESSRVLRGAGVVLVFTVPMVRILIHSDVNGGGYASMPIALASWASLNVGAVWPGVAGVVGALGAFIAGSNTVSNMMLVQFQYGVAQNLAISGLMVVALQAVGAAAGNMIAIHNVVAASASVGLLGEEGTTLRKTLLPTLFYLTMVGILGLVAVYGLHLADPLQLPKG